MGLINRLKAIFLPTGEDDTYIQGKHFNFEMVIEYEQ